jgi:hypothetical protein
MLNGVRDAMNWFFYLLGLTSMLSVAAAVAAALLALFRRWARARTIARFVTLVSGGVVLLVVSAIILGITDQGLAMWILDRLIRHGDPSERARILAEGISEMINCSALFVPALVIASPVWFISRKRVARTEARP